MTKTQELISKIYSFESDDNTRKLKLTYEEVKILRDLLSVYI